MLKLRSMVRRKPVSETCVENYQAPVSRLTRQNQATQNKQHTFSTQDQLSNYARRYATILQLLFTRQGISGKLERATRGARHLSFGVRLNDPLMLGKTLKLAETVAYASRSKAVLTHRQGGLIIFQYQLPALYWQAYTRQDVTGLGVGLGEMRRQINFQFRESAPHTLIAGSSGSGKSETIRSTLMALLQTYSPTDLKLILIDPHHDYDAFANVAHLVAPIANQPETIDQCLQYAYQQFEHRRANDIRNDYRLVVVIDEGDEILESNAKRLGIVRNLVNGRKFKLNVLLGSLKPTHKDLPGILDKLQNRFVGLVSDAGMSARLTGQAGLEAHRLTGSGDFLHVIGATVERFQVALATKADYTRLERAEIANPTIESDTVYDLPPKTSGRPKNELEPTTLAHYLYHKPENISVRIASQQGITRGVHTLHRDFSTELLIELERLGLHLCQGGSNE